MKSVVHKLISFIKRVFFFLRLHVHVEAGVRGSNNESNNQEDSSTPELKD